MCKLIFWCYCNAIEIVFKDDAKFVVFNNLISFLNGALPLVWAMNLACLDPNVVWCALHMCIEFAWLHVDDLQIGQMEPISLTLWEQYLKNVNAQCYKATF